VERLRRRGLAVVGRVALQRLFEKDGRGKRRAIATTQSLFSHHKPRHELREGSRLERHRNLVHAPPAAATSTGASAARARNNSQHDVRTAFLLLLWSAAPQRRQQRVLERGHARRPHRVAERHTQRRIPRDEREPLHCPTKSSCATTHRHLPSAATHSAASSLIPLEISLCLFVWGFSLGGSYRRRRNYKHPLQHEQFSITTYFHCARAGRAPRVAAAAAAVVVAVDLLGAAFCVRAAWSGAVESRRELPPLAGSDHTSRPPLLAVVEKTDASESFLRSRGGAVRGRVAVAEAEDDGNAAAHGSVSMMERRIVKAGVVCGSGRSPVYVPRALNEPFEVRRSSACLLEGGGGLPAVVVERLPGLRGLVVSAVLAVDGLWSEDDDTRTVEEILPLAGPLNDDTERTAEVAGSDAPMAFVEERLPRDTDGREFDAVGWRDGWCVDCDGRGAGRFVTGVALRICCW
jgi:hypothetical protein